MANPSPSPLSLTPHQGGGFFFKPCQLAPNGARNCYWHSLRSLTQGDNLSILGGTFRTGSVLVWGIHAVNIPLVSDIPMRTSHSLSKVAMDSLSTIGAFTKSSS